MKKLNVLDLYKTIAAIMVILIHVTATPVVTLKSGLAFDLLLAVNRFSKPSVPMFIFASGLALSYSYLTKGRVFRYGEFLTRRLTRILIPYLAWCGLYYGYFVWQEIYPFDFALLFKLTANGKMMYHLYFVVIILQFYLIFGLLLPLVRELPGRFLLPAAMAVNLVILPVLPADLMGRSFPTYLFYFVLGCYFAKNLDKAHCLVLQWKWPLMALFLGTGILYTYQFYEDQVLGLGYRFVPDSTIYLVFSAVAILVYYLWAMQIEKHGPCWIKDGMMQLSQASFYIYLSHPAAMIFAGALAVRLGITGVVDQMLVSLVGITVLVLPLSVAYAKVKGR